MTALNTTPPGQVHLMNPTLTRDQQISLLAMRMAHRSGVWKECMAQACIPSLEEIEAQLGRDLLQQARHMVMVNNTNHRAAGLALNERVPELRSVNAVAWGGI